MWIYSNALENSNNLSKLAQQQKIQEAIESKNKFLKQTHEKNLAKLFTPITKKVKEVDKPTKKNWKNEYKLRICNWKSLRDSSCWKYLRWFGGWEKNTKNLPNVPTTSESMRHILGFLMSLNISLKIEQVESAKASFLGVAVGTLGADTFRMKDIVYDLAPEIHKTLSSTSHTGKR